MDRRKLLLMLAVFVAIIGTALVFLYVRGADNRAQSQFDSVTVLKATQNIASGEAYDDAVAAGKIASASVPQTQLNDGYQTSITALKGKIASVPIFAGQQIISGQFGNEVVATSTNLPIPKGMIAVTVQLSDPDRVAGNVYPGSRVAIFATGMGGPEHSSGSGATAGGTGVAAAAETALLLPNVLVLNVGSPVQSTSTTTDESGNQTTESLPRTLLTLAVDQAEAQKVILASKGVPDSLTFGLLTNTSQVKKGPGTSTANVWK